MLRTDFERKDLFNYNPSLKLHILESVLERLNGVYVPMGSSYEQKVLRAGTEYILSTDWKKSDIYFKSFKISTKIEKILIFTSCIAFN